MKLNILVPVLVAAMLTVNVVNAEDNVHLSGALVAEPCTLPDSDTDIHVDFGTVITKYLYQYHRTKSQWFTIHLNDCDPSVMKTVSVTFEGTADNELKDMLKLDVNSSAKGIAIGFEDEDGNLLKINESSSFKQVREGDNELKFGAYISASPSSLINNTIALGDFTATSSFVLMYE